MSLDKTHPCVILTGGPGGGKTSLIEELRKRGYPCVEEVGRAIIQSEVEAGGDALPWANKERFKQKMFDAQLKAYEEREDGKVVFFDRGLLDTLAYAKLEGLTITDEMVQIAKEVRFHHKVFITPPWEEIYSQDEERKQDFAEAVRTYEHMAEIYREYGYTVVDLPKKSVEERVKFILNQL